MTGATDLEVIAAQIGRAPRGDVAVSVRCRHGVPMVIRTSPRLADGRPFPTLFWLTCPARYRSVARLETNGLIAKLQARVGEEPTLAAELARAAAAYRGDRDRARADLPNCFVGGAADPLAVKCLHAHYAHYLATGGNPIGEIVDGLLSGAKNESWQECAGCRRQERDDGAGART